ncbi:MAG: DUF5723 family protein [Bacteroidota bacterium]
MSNQYAILLRRSLCFLLLLWGLWTPTTINAQQELGLHLMREVGHSNQTNPAFTGQNGFYIGLPSVYFNYVHTAGSINELVRSDNGANLLNMSTLIRNADEDNLLNVNFELETFNLQYRLGAFGFGISHAAKSTAWLQYSETLPKLFWEGNAQYVGQEVAFGPNQQSIAYHELGLSVSYTLGNLTIGGKAKLLSGIGDVSTDRTEARLRTDDDIYQLSLVTDYRINTSTFDNKIIFDSLSNVGLEYTLDELFQYENLFSSNTGFAFDLGLQYKLGERLDIALSVLDIGQITWKEKLTNFTSQGTFAYDGLEFSNILQDEELSFEGTLDTLEKIFSFEETSNGYSTRLASKIYFSALYQLTDRWRIGGLYYNENFRGRTNHAFALSADMTLTPYLRVGASYVSRNDTYDNLGLNVNLRLGPVRIFGTTDNVLAAFRPFDSRNVNGRIGLALELGALGKAPKAEG